MPYEDEDEFEAKPPASEDPKVQDYLDTSWRETMRATKEALETLRRIHPELTHHLVETASNQIGAAMRDLEATIDHLHRAGRLVLGDDDYEEYLDTQTQRQLSS